MRRSISGLTIALLVGLVLGLLLAGGNQVIGQGNGNSLNSHHQEITFSANESIQYPITLPKADVPVFVAVSVTNIVVEGQLKPSESFAGFFVLESTTNQMSGMWSVEGGGISGDNYSINLETPKTSGLPTPTIELDATSPNIMTQPATIKLSIWY